MSAGFRIARGWMFLLWRQSARAGGVGDSLFRAKHQRHPAFADVWKAGKKKAPSFDRAFFVQR
ncbi:hypothetical protein [Burkholderia aenigmatica]|uniref:hypothetical protein n=1 Tax=Burkholderia aenigmatica TaxID=2015348 RepID=UPI0011778E41|nr:hypothetical protein [Burkholderia aenigmatica]